MTNLSKRRGIIGFLAYAAAFLDPSLQRKAAAQSNQTSTSGVDLLVPLTRPKTLSLFFEDDGFSELTVEYKGQRVTITAKEVMEALKG